MKATPLKETVKRILTQIALTRDEDALLMMCVWKEHPRVSDTTSILTVTHLLRIGELPQHESITRCRRKLQELHPELRGKRYKERQTTEQQEMKQDIKFGDWQSVNIERPILTDTDHPNQLKIC